MKGLPVKMGTLVLLMTLFALMRVSDVHARDAASTPPPVATPQGEIDREGETTATGGRVTPRVIQYTLDPSAAILDVVNKVMVSFFIDAARSLASNAKSALRFIVQTFTSEKNLVQDKFQAAGNLLLTVSKIFFVIAALLRLAWYQKARLQGLPDSITDVVAEWVIIGLLVVSLPAIMDWTEDFGFRLGHLVYQNGSRIFVQSGDLNTFLKMFVHLNTPVVGMVSAFLLFLYTLIMLVVVLALLASVVAMQAAMFIFAVLAPFLLSLSLMPPFRFVRRVMAMAYLVMLVAPIVAALAVLILVWLPGTNIGGQGFLGFTIRLVWAAASAGLLWKVASILGMAGLDAFRAAAGALLQAFRTTASVLLGVTALGLTSGGAAAAAGMAGASAQKTAVSGAVSGTAQQGAAALGREGNQTATTLSAATQKLRTAEGLGMAAHVLGGYNAGGRLGLAVAGYARTLRQRLEGTKGMNSPANEVTPPPPHQKAFEVAKALGLSDEATYRRALEQVQSRLAAVQAGEEPLSPAQWSEKNAKNAPLAGALAYLYYTSPERFDALLEEGGWPLLQQEAQSLLQRLSQNRG